MRRDAQVFIARCRALARKWPEHRVAIDRAIVSPLPTPLKPNADAPMNHEIVDALQTSTIDRLQLILLALDHIISPPTPISDAEFVRRCNQYIVIGGQITRRVKGMALDAAAAERSDLTRRVQDYLSEVYLFFNEHRPKYWLRMVEVSSEPPVTRHVELRLDDMVPRLAELHPGGYAEMLSEQIDRAVRTLREAVNAS
jgi:hypothetical protein